MIATEGVNGVKLVSRVSESSVCERVGRVSLDYAGFCCWALYVAALGCVGMAAKIKPVAQAMRCV